MATVTYSARALADLQRLSLFIVGKEPSIAGLATARVLEAILLLERHPLLGRQVEGGFRELIISRGRTGYMALYRYVEPIDLVIVMGLRHQREAGYS